MGNFSGKINPGNVGALGQGVFSGLEFDQNLQKQYLANQGTAQENAAWRLTNQGNQGQYNATQDFYNRQNPNGPQGQPFQAQTGSVFDPVRERISGMLASAHQAYQKVFGGAQTPHAVGPAAQATTPQGSNVAASPPGPTSSNGSGGQIGATGPMPQMPQTRNTFAEGGAIPGRKGLKARKAKPGNLAKPTQGEKQVAQTNMPQPPATGGADEGPPRNTEPGAGISNQDPQLADGGIADPGTAVTGNQPKAEYNAIQADADGGKVKKNWVAGAIKKPGALHRDLGVPEGEKIPKSKIKAAEKGGGKTAQRARLADTMSKWKDGGMPSLPKLQPGAAPEPKPAPKALEQEVSNDGQRNRLGKTIKRFADGGDTAVPTPAGLKIPPHEDPGLSADLYKFNATQPEYAGMKPPVSPGQGASPPQTSMASAAQGTTSNTPAGAGAQGVLPPRTPASPPGALPYEADRAAANAKLRAGGYQEDVTAGATPVPGAEQRGQNLVDAVNADKLISGNPVHAGANAAAQPEMQGPPAPDKIDFSKVNIDHTQIPTTTTQDWQDLERATALNYAAHGHADGVRQANADITGLQHDNFMDYMRQGAALDAAGNKQGAMAAYKTAYNYFPTGHDMHFGLGQDGTIVGFGVNEQTGQPVQNGAIRLDQQNVHGIMTHFANPENFVSEGIRMQTSANETAHITQGQITLERAQAERARAQSEYLGGRNATQLAVAETRAQAQAFGHLHPNIQAFYTSNLKDLPNAGDAEDVAGQLEAKAAQQGTVDEAHRTQFLGIVRHLFDPTTPPEERAAFMQKYGLTMPGQTAQNNPVPGRYDDPYRTGMAIYGQ